MKKFIQCLLPQHNTHKYYKRFAGWSFISNVILSAEYAMCTHCMLTAIDSGSDVHRTGSYIGKDIIGQIGSLGYIAYYGKQADDNPKRFLTYSNVIQQTGIMAVSITPLYPSIFLPVAGIANILSNISCVGIGALNAKCIQTLSDDNLGEVYAKITMINTIGSSLGLCIGMGIVTLVPDHTQRLCILPILGFLRILTFDRAVKVLF